MPENSNPSGVFYYLLIDGTDAVDSVAFGAKLTAVPGPSQWRNLLDCLDADPSEPARLVSPGHGFLPMYRLRRSGASSSAPVVPDPAGIAVVCPAGTNAFGLDRMWQHYRDPAGRPYVHFHDENSGRSYYLLGRHAAAELSARAITPLMLQPVVEVIGDGENARKQLACDYAPDGSNPLHRASLIYISSHGWLGGFAMGNALRDWDEAGPVPPLQIEDENGNPRVISDDPRMPFWPQRKYFVIGQLDAAGHGFCGPEWIVLAQCSTVNHTTLAMWARVMARSFPQVRGVLGYEEASPAARASIGIADAFIQRLQRGDSFFEAWKAANHGQNWAAIVHRQALGDTLPGFASRAPLQDQSMASYVAAASRTPSLVPVTDPPPPFAVRVSNESERVPAARGKITAATLDSDSAALAPETRYRVVVELPGGAITQVRIQWIHIRESFKQFPAANVFRAIYVDEYRDIPVDLRDPFTATFQLNGSDSSVAICFETHGYDQIAASGLETAHSYLWPRVYVSGNFNGRTGTDIRYDAKDRGLLW